MSEVRLIDANALKKAFKNKGEGVFKLSRVNDIIDNAPTVLQVTVFAENASKEEIEDFKQELENVLERPQGEWINTSPYDDKGECSLCCYLSKKYYNFCPNCGSDMRGRRSDSE